MLISFHVSNYRMLFISVLVSIWEATLFVLLKAMVENVIALEYAHAKSKCLCEIL